MITLTLSVDSVDDLRRELFILTCDIDSGQLEITEKPETIYLDNGKIEVTE